MKKSLPEFTWQNVAPPYEEHVYFQQGESYPFQPNAEHFGLVNAWWLSEAATLVYADEAFVRPRFEQAGLPELRYFCGKSTDCFVVSNATYIWVVFRGTEIRKRPDASDFEHILADIKADCNILPMPADRGQGNVHKGFSDALDEVWQELRKYIAALHTGPRTIWFAGHSLGAALATLAAARYGRAQGVYTFGSPRVGDTVFRDHFPTNIYRVVNGRDVITTVPLPPLYRHVGELWYLDSEGQLQHNIESVDLLTDGIRGEASHIAESFRQISRGKFLYIPGGFKDHIPLLYAIHLWNNLVK